MKEQIGEFDAHILYELLCLGFTQTQTTWGFKGNLHTKKGNIEVTLFLFDMDFLNPPPIVIDPKHYELFPRGIPHVFGNDDMRALCYLDRESVRLDPYDPVKTIRQCLARATSVLDQLMDRDLPEDIDREIQTYWSGYRKNYLVSPIDKKKGVSNYIAYSATTVKSDVEEEFWCVLGTKESVNRQYNAWNIPSEERRESPAIAILLPVGQQDERSPHWPIKHWGDLLAVIRYIHPPAYDQFLQHLAHKKNRVPLVAFLFQSPGGSWGGLLLPKTTTQYQATKKISRKNYIKKMKEDNIFFDVTKLSFQDATDNFVYSRNNNQNDNLCGKRILLLGVGTVGGFLCRQLVQLGGGINGGHIDIFDKDDLSAGNLGRHYLDRQYLGKNKAESIQNKLLKEFFNLSINGVPSHWEHSSEHPPLSSYDVIIDATGFDAFSTKLNRINAEKGRQIPILHTWVEGAGETAIAFWNHGNACHRCLHYDDRGIEIAETLHIDRYFRCGESYLPYLSASSEIAASLAIQLLHQHINGVKKYNMAYVHLTKKMVAKAKRVDRSRQCEVCQT